MQFLGGKQHLPSHIDVIDMQGIEKYATYAAGYGKTIDLNMTMQERLSTIWSS
jgi:hypothetical protein